MHVVITGASAGIGEALAREFHKRGATLSLLARRKQKLEQLAKELGSRSHIYSADLANPKAAAATLAECARDQGPVDVLVNNAGVQIIAAAQDTDPDEGERLLALNVATPLRLIHDVLPSMLERKQGTIVNMASMAGLSPVPNMLYYNASKGGLGNASEALRGELAGTGVNVLTVYPGPVHTAMGDSGIEKYEATSVAEMAPWGTAEELASLVVRAVELREASIIYPRAYAISRWFPNLSRWFSLRFAPPLKSQS